MGYRGFVDLKESSLNPNERDIVDSVHRNVVLVRPSGDASNDTDAIRHARDLAKSGGTVELTPGSFQLSQFVGFYDNTAFIGSGPATDITFTKPMDVGLGNIDSVGGNTRIHIGNMRIDGADLVNDPIELNNCSDSTISKVWVSQGNHDGIELQNCTRCIISESICHDANTISGIELDSCTRCIVADCIVHSNGGSGFEIDGTSSNNIISGGVSWNNTAHGVLMNASTSNNAALNVLPQSNGGFSLIDNGTNNTALLAQAGKIAIGGDDPAHRLSVHARGSGQSYAHFSNNDTGQTSTSGFSVGYDGSSSSAIVWHRENELLRFTTNNAEVMRMLGTYMYHQAPNAAPSDGNIPTQYVSFYLNEAGNTLNVRVRYSDGTTLKTGTIALV